MDSLTALNTRVVAPPTVAVPESTGEIVWRAASAGDIDGVLECARAMDAVDHPHFSTTREEVEEEFGHSYVCLDTDSLVAVDRAGRILAFGFTVLSPAQETLVRSILQGGVRPEARGQGLGRQLLEWQQARALQQLARSEKTLPGWMMIWTDERAGATVRLATRSGFRIARYFLELQRDLAPGADAAPVAEHALDGLEIVAFDASRSEDVRLAKNDAFRDHWGSQPTPEENWNSMIGRSTFRSDLSFVAVAPNGEIAGLVLSEVNEEDFALQGFSSAYIELVGVPRAYRRRGVAPALLARTLRAIAEAGLERAVLDVDSDNPTGALGLYTRLGFVEANRSLNLVREF